MQKEKIDLLDTRTNNIGDFFQFDIIQKILKEKNKEIHTIRHPEDAKSDKLICYGSVIRPHFFEAFANIKSVITFLGTGIYTQLSNLKLTKKSLEILSTLNFDYIGVRGPLTKQALQLNNAQIIGDIGYYNEYSYKEIKEINTVVISLPPQNIKFQKYAQFLKEIFSYFSSIKKIIAIDNGYSGGYIYEDFINKLECKYIQIKDLNTFHTICDKTDLHVGFRLHSHIFSLSRGIPSFLIYYDSRGLDNKLAFQLKYDVLFSKNYEEKIIKNISECIDNNFAFFRNNNFKRKL